MSPEECVDMKNKLEALCALYGRKGLNQVAITIWFQNLQEFPLDVVLWALDRWPSTNDAYPVLSKIRPQVIEECARRCRERDRRLQQERGSSVGQRAQITVMRDAIQKITDIESRPRNQGRSWAHKLKAAEMAGKHLNMYQAWMWRTALGERYESHTETDDAREARLEREAIQAEAA